MSALRRRIYGYGFVLLLAVAIAYFFVGAGEHSRITLAESKVVSVKLWGNGLDGADASPEDKHDLIQWINTATNYREEPCCGKPAPPAPLSRVLVHGADDVSVTYWADGTLTLTGKYGSYFVEQKDLVEYMEEMALFW